MYNTRRILEARNHQLQENMHKARGGMWAYVQALLRHASQSSDSHCFTRVPTCPQILRTRLRAPLRTGPQRTHGTSTRTSLDIVPLSSDGYLNSRPFAPARVLRIHNGEFAIDRQDTASATEGEDGILIGSDKTRPASTRCLCGELIRTLRPCAHRCV